MKKPTLRPAAAATAAADDGQTIQIKGARVNNLKNIDVRIPRDKLIVVTGLSGSGKSSLAFDTLYAEGQRRYVESLSAYARQFLGRMKKPDCDYIKGIPPAIAIEQKVTNRNSRSTVGTSTEIYDYLRLLFARIGHTISPVSGQEVKRHTVKDVTDCIASYSPGTRFTVLAPMRIRHGRTLREQLEVDLKQGLTRLDIDGELVHIEDVLKGEVKLKELEGVKGELEGVKGPIVAADETAANKTAPDETAADETTANSNGSITPPNSPLTPPNSPKIYLLIDRLSAGTDRETLSRLADSVQTAFYEGDGRMMLRIYPARTLHFFSGSFEADGITFEEPTDQTFSFNSPLGACPHCEGFGKVIGIDEHLVVPDTSLSVHDGAVVCWRGEKMSQWRREFCRRYALRGFPIFKPYADLSRQEKDALWHGDDEERRLPREEQVSVDAFFDYVQSQQYKIQYRVMLARYRGKTVCPHCHGSRLKPEALYVKVGGRHIGELVEMPVSDLARWFDALQLPEHEARVGERLLAEIKSRLKFLQDVGLGYLTLSRQSSTLSGGESQRINLATSLGSSLVGSLYILDEPSIGLHSRDTARLISVLQALRDAGNTVLIVEHDEEIMRAADYVIDIGPEAGTGGGEVVLSGTLDEIKAMSPQQISQSRSHTAKYLNCLERISVPATRRPWNRFIEVNGARENNLRAIDVRFPLNVLTVVTGVSGSGKSTLVRDILYNALMRHFDLTGAQRPGQHTALGGDLDAISAVEFVDQNPIGKSTRSNPVTYVKAYDEIRALMAAQPLAKQQGFTPAYFSFNTDGGRCEECKGDGTVKVEMQFMADLNLTCEACGGKRFKRDVLEVRYEGKNIHDILEMTVDEALSLFGQHGQQRVCRLLQPLQDVGLGYVKLGQSSSTLSGGENQRVKLAYYIGTETARPTLFIFDEPTTGLHFHDISRLLRAFDALIARGHSILIIEHNAEIIKCADWCIDLGPEGGEQGGRLVAQGTPEQLVAQNKGYTARFLAEKLTAPATCNRQ
ncbi:MAG: excinuclease ABC subunit UvrA [Bacteroidaceae bacterium]|nr:excinuclease ABC subunit UvrA [Bacteroidaceae bacterium]